MDYQYIKLGYFKENFAGDSAFIQEILTLFLEDIPDKMAALNHQANEGNWGAVGETAHSIKASIKMMGLDDLYDDIVRIEHAAKNKQSIEKLLPQLEKVKQELDKAMAEIEHYQASLT